MGSGPSSTTKTKEQTAQDTLQNATTGVTGTNLSQGNTTGQTYNLSGQNSATAQQTQQQQQSQEQSQQQGITGSSNYSATNAYAPTEPILANIIDAAKGISANPSLTSTEQGALTGLQGQATGVAGYNPQIEDTAGYMLSGGGFGEGDQYVKSGWDSLNDALGKTAEGYYLDQSNPYLQSMLSGARDDITNKVGSTFAGAGRSFSGAHSAALGEGMAGAVAPILFNNWQFERGQQADAGKALAAGGTAASGALGANRSGALGAMEAAPGMLRSTYDPFTTMLTGAQLGRNIPLDTLSKVNDIIMPMASGFGEKIDLGSGYANTNTNTIGNTNTNTNSQGVTSTIGQDYGLSNQQDQQLTQNDVLTMLQSLGKQTGKSSGTSTTQQTIDPLTAILGAGTMLGSAYLGRA